VAVPTTVQLLNGQARLVDERTVKEALGVLVKLNWRTPLASSCTPVRFAGVPIVPCVMGMGSLGCDNRVKVPYEC
jgi:hypothetical protein